VFCHSGETCQLKSLAGGLGFLWFSEGKYGLKVLVTGATGFIGSHLVEALIHREHHVRCLVRATSDMTWLKGLPVEYIRGDCCDPDSLQAAVKDVEQVFHLAGVTKAVRAKTFFDVNALGTANLINACLRTGSGVRKFIYVSSQAAAGPAEGGVKKKESDPCRPVSFYGGSKLEGEKFVLSRREDIPVVILRPCAVYGPRERDLFFFFKMVSKGIKPILGGGEQRVSLCHVEDVVRAILLAHERDGCSGGVFFISDGCDYRTGEVVDTLATAMGVGAHSVRIPKAMIQTIALVSGCLGAATGRAYLIGRDKARELLQRDWTCDITAARTMLDFHPCIPLLKGAESAVQWYRANGWL